MNRRKFFGILAAAPAAATMMAPHGFAQGGMAHAYGRVRVGERVEEFALPPRKFETLSIKLDEGEMASAVRRIEANIRADLARLHAPDADQTFSEGAGI
jgi:hypothetical protein